jgi:hypothetical protein
MRLLFIQKANEQVMKKITDRTDNPFIHAVISLIDRLKRSSNLASIEEPLLFRLIDEAEMTNDPILLRLVADLCTSIIHSGATTLDELISFAPGYVPTLKRFEGIGNFVAEQYDKAHESIGSTVRAF